MGDRAKIAQYGEMYELRLDGNRRLKDHGTTFQCVLDEVRFSVARQLLATSEMCLDDVAASLGYALLS